MDGQTDRETGLLVGWLDDEARRLDQDVCFGESTRFTYLPTYLPTYHRRRSSKKAASFHPYAEPTPPSTLDHWIYQR